MKSTKNQISILTIILFSILLIIIPSNVYAEEIEVKSFSLDETAILQVTNYSNESLDKFRIWLGNDNSFKSFKTEKGWSGEKTPQGTIIFTSTKSLEPQETVKFGIKTEKPNSGINWKALNKNGGQMDIGKTISQEIPQIETNPIISQNVGEGIKTESTFRIIPEKPNVGSSIRITGDGFGAKHEFDFYVDTYKIGSFTTDDKGHFITTMNITNEIKPGRSDFKIKDILGAEKKISLRIGEINNRILDDVESKLTILNIPNILHRGDSFDISGTAQPGSTIIMEIFNPNNDIENVRNIKVKNTGNWKTEQSVSVPLDAVFGEYRVTISNGKDQISRNWNIESDKIINILSNNEKIEQGEIMKFSGTAKPNKTIEVIIEDPIGKEIFIENFQVDNSGEVNFEYQTELSHLKGTYTIIMSQGIENEKIFVGIGQSPETPIDIKFDKTNYDSSEIANIELTGKALEIINLLIIDPTYMTKGEPISITLQKNGKATYQLNLQNYNSGIYTAQVSKGNSQSSKSFAVGLQTGSGEITINTTKMNYLPGESILVLGDTGKNSILKISLSDPDGKIIKEKEIFSDKEGIISDDSFRVPENAISGTWVISCKSGSNFDSTSIQILSKEKQGMVITVEKETEVTTVGEIITIKISGVQQTIEIKIVDENEEIIQVMTLQASENGEIDLPWLIPENMENGTYTIVAKDAINSAELDFEIQ